MAVVSGLVCIVAGVARLGFVTELLSKPIRYGYMNGIALTVLVSQLPELFGFPGGGDELFERVETIAAALAAGKINWVAFALGAGALAIILALKNFKNIPAVLIAVAAATAIVGGFGLDDAHGVAVLGPLPRGLPQFAVPTLGAEALGPVIAGGFAVAMVSFADTSVLSRAYAARLKQRVDPNQEMIGLGAANLAAGFFQGFPISSSSSRTPVAEAAGARTQLAGVVGALGVAALLVFAPNLLENLPRSALAAVVIASAIGLFEIGDLARIYRIQQWEFWLSMACFAGVAVLGVIPGICLAVVAAVIEFLWDGWRPHYAILGRAAGLKGYHDMSSPSRGAPNPGAGAVPLGRAAVFRQRANFFASARWRPSRRRPVRRAGW